MEFYLVGDIGSFPKIVILGVAGLPRHDHPSRSQGFFSYKDAEELMQKVGQDIWSSMLCCGGHPDRAIGYHQNPQL